MATGELIVHNEPSFQEPRLVMGFSGWMDGGEVSTGTVAYLRDALGAEKFAEIDPEGYYIYNFPGVMEITALFRPHTRIQDGLIEVLKTPTNFFYACPENDLILFSGREPNLHWRGFGQCIFTLCHRFNVKRIYFVGSVSGLVPHTRQPRLFCSVSNPQLKQTFKHYAVTFTNYEGPASIVTYLTHTCNGYGLEMVSLVATVPAYVQGNNPKCIAAVTRRLCGMLNIRPDLDELDARSDQFEKKLDEIVEKQPELAGHIRKLEEDYDNEIFNNEMSDLKQWLQQQGIRVD